MARVSLERVSKRYGEVEAVRELTLEIPDRELVVLVGPSGCGKSTTLRMIAGLGEVSGGEIRIGDRRVTELPPKDRDIAMVFQSYALYPHMTVRQNLEFGLKMRRTSRTEIAERVAEAAAILNIEPLLDRKPRQLSGGQRQRVAMGRAIVRRPAVFLFDEPLSNLDARLRMQMRTEISRLHSQLQTTTVYVTHDQLEAMTLADRIVVMKDGVVQQVGAPLELYHNPQNLFVAGFIGTPAMNFLAGELAVEMDRVCFLRGGLRLPLGRPGGEAPAPRQPGQRVLLGVRPPDLTLCSEPGSERLSARVEVREPLGAEIFLHLDEPLAGWVVRVDGNSPVEEGELVHLDLRPGGVHVFDEITEQRLEA